MLEIRRMTEKDLEQVTDLEREAFGTEAWKRKDFEDSLKLGYALYLVASEKDQIIGMAGLRNICGDADMTNVAVRSAERRKGIAEKILSELMLRGEEMGVSNYTLEVRAKNTPALNLYKKLGFECEGIRKNFYENPHDDALIMWKRKEDEC